MIILMDFFRFVYPSPLSVPIPFGSRLRVRLVPPAGSGPGGISLRRDPETSLGAREAGRRLSSLSRRLCLGRPLWGRAALHP